MLPVRQLDVGAGAALDELPGVALEIDRGSALAGRAWSRSAIVLAFECNAEALLFLAAIAASASALVSGPAAARVASAVETAPARTSELTTCFVDMNFSSRGLLPIWANIVSSSRSQPSLRSGLLT